MSIVSRRISKVLGAVVLASVGTLHAPPCHAQNSGITIAPLNSIPEGQTYGRWAAAWFQWVYSIPEAENPLKDTTGVNCGQRQVDKVWFLVGCFCRAQQSVHALFHRANPCFSR
jgi:hypothetical protein